MRVGNPPEPVRGAEPILDSAGAAALPMAGDAGSHYANDDHQCLGAVGTWVRGEGEVRRRGVGVAAWRSRPGARCQAVRSATGIRRRPQRTGANRGMGLPWTATGQAGHARLEPNRSFFLLFPALTGTTGPGRVRQAFKEV